MILLPPSSGCWVHSCGPGLRWLVKIRRALWCMQAFYQLGYSSMPWPLFLMHIFLSKHKSTLLCITGKRIRCDILQRSPLGMTTIYILVNFSLTGPIQFWLQREAPRTDCPSSTSNCGMVTSDHVISQPSHTPLFLFVGPLWTVTTQSSFFFSVEIKEEMETADMS